MVHLCFVCTACSMQAWHESGHAVDVYIAKWNGKYHGYCCNTAQCSAVQHDFDVSVHILVADVSSAWATNVLSTPLYS